MVKVTCAIITHNRKILAVQRSATMSLPNKWEFPGGKIESDETEEECIIREIKEELSIDITLKKRLTPVIFQYTSVTVLLIPFIAYFTRGEIVLAEHEKYLWVKKNDLSGLDWADADIPILKEFLSL
jgi:8-oxo-dGTP diphosphatase